MDVTQLSSWDVTGCSQVTGRRDVQPLIERALTYARDSIAAGVPPHSAATAGGDNGVAPAPGNRVALDWIGPELERLEVDAKGGDATSARRVAELYELLEDMDTASTWWHVAARLGDPDAVEYVRVILGR